MVVCRLLGSQVNSDVYESIEFVVIAHEFGLNNALLGVRRMLSLVWSKDNDVKSKVVDAYERLYLNPQVQGARYSFPGENLENDSYMIMYKILKRILHAGCS